ncbi:MAG TPA: PA14 domain-containing protein [Kofleriaceae bacterium]|nr:PA14 domain-containing protein [Kofleriaceae bacterium]
MRRRLFTLVLVGGLWGAGACAFRPSEELSDGAASDADVDGSELDAEVDIDGAVDATDGAVDATDAAIDADIDGATDAAIDAATDAAVDAPTDAGIDAGPIVGRTLVDDTASELGAGPAVHDGRIDAAGLFAPRAYYVGGLCAGGSDARLFDDGTTATWPAPSVLKPSLWRGTAVAATPTGVGITDASDWTLVLDGEVFLTAGMHMFTLTADDHAVLELAPPGSATFTRVAGANVGAPMTAPYLVAADGWYGIRYALAQRTGPAAVQVQLDGAALSRHQVRCRVDLRQGLAMTASEQSHFLDVVGTTIDGTPQVTDVDWGGNRPTDLGLTSNDTFTVRWSGQVRIDVAGTYTLRFNTDDGQRLWIDGVKVLDAFDDAPHDATTAALTLAAGWHDVVADVTENAGNARAVLTVASGPELVGQPFPPARLRPAEARSERFEARTITTDTAIEGSATFRIDAPAGAIVTGVDVGYRIAHPSMLTVRSTLTRGSTTVGLRTSASNATVDRFHPTGFAGLDPTGTWTLTFTDVSVQSGTLQDAWLTVHYREPSGRGPIAATARLESSVRDLLAPAGGAGAVLSVDQVRFVARDVPGDTIGVYLRTCDDPSGCAAEAWLGPYASGASPGVVPRRYLQYAVAIASDTDHEPALDRVEVDYQTQ